MPAEHLPQYEAILGDYPAFLDSLTAQAEAAGITLADKFIDHLAFRASSLDDYEAMKHRVGTIATLLGEPTINGRPIAVFEFDNPLQYGEHSIPYLELLAPAPNGPQFNRGLEHIEVVVDDPLNLPNQFPELAWKVAAGRVINPEAMIQFGDYTVKFHPLNIADAMREQQARGML